MDDANATIKFMAPVSARTHHLYDLEKLSGISGSACPSHPTIFSQRFVSGTGGRSSFSFFLLFVGVFGVVCSPMSATASGALAPLRSIIVIEVVSTALVAPTY